MFSIGVEFIVSALIGIMLWVPPFVLIAIFVLIGWFLHRSWKLVVLIVASLLLVINLGYWEETVQTLGLMISSAMTCVLIGVPVGIAAAHRKNMYTFLRPVLDLMQTVPAFVYLIPTMIMFGLGLVPGLISTVIFAIPAPIRLTYLGVTGVPRMLVEAGESLAQPNGSCCGKWNSHMPCQRSWLGSHNRSCCLCPWWLLLRWSERQGWGSPYCGP